MQGLSFQPTLSVSRSMSLTNVNSSRSCKFLRTYLKISKIASIQFRLFARGKWGSLRLSYVCKFFTYFRSLTRPKRLLRPRIPSVTSQLLCLWAYKRLNLTVEITRARTVATAHVICCWNWKIFIYLKVFFTTMFRNENSYMTFVWKSKISQARSRCNFIPLYDAVQAISISTFSISLIEMFTFLC